MVLQVKFTSGRGGGGGKYVGSSHEKVTIIDNTLVLMGSYNYTWSAENINRESLIVLHTAKIIEDYRIHFKNSWDKCA